MRKLYLFLFFMALTFTLSAQVTLVPYASSWKYLDNGSDQGTAWRSLSFDDASWNSGSGKFGYGLPDASTVISYGPNASNKYVTTYFRKVVNITSPSSYTSFTCNVKRDDGVVVYVNGKEVYRNKMPSGTVTYSTLANSSGDKGVVPKTFPIKNTFFTSGNNVIAVEIHIEKPTTSIEMAFDLELLGTPSTTPADQTPPIVQSISRLSPTTETTTATTVTYRVAFSEKVVGVHAGDFAATAVSGTVSGTPSSVAAVGTDGTTYDVTVNAISGTGSLRLDLKSSGTGITDNAGNAITGGFTSGQSYIIEPITTTTPTVFSINRQLPNTSTTNATSVVYRATFSQGVTGVDAGDFTANTTSGTITGTPTAVASVGSDGSTYDITVSSITGTGTLRLDLKETGTGITNLEGTAISGGFTSGQTYTLAEVVSNAIVSYGASWKYLDDGSNQGTAWQSISFDEASWKTGNGKFGYGITDASTVVSYGLNATNKYITTYFRKTLNIANPSAATIYHAGVKRDDGVVIYVNGKEVFRNKMPSGTPTYTTLAASGGDKGVTPKAFTISPSAFVSGINVIAVEVHVQTADAPSMAFDLEIIGDQPSTDQTPPTVTSIDRQSPSTANTNASSVVYRVVFSESVQNVDAGDFATSGSGVSGTPFSIAVVGTDGTTYDVTVNTVAGNGSLRLDLKSAGTGITDAAGNAISGGYTSGQVYQVDQALPAVVSINRQSPATEMSTSTTVVFRTIFSEKVRGVDHADFTLPTVEGGVSGTLAPDAVTVVGGDSTTYDITVSALAGSGTLRLDLNNSSTGITDVSGNVISGGLANGESYIITQSVPTLTSVGITSSNNNASLAKVGDVVTLSFTASEPINTPTVTIANHSVDVVAEGENSFTVAYTMTAEDAEGLVPFNISFSDTTGNAGTPVNATTNSSSVTFDRTVPAITSINRQSPASETTSETTVTFRAIFSERINGVDADDFAVAIISGSVSGSVSGVAAVGVDGNIYDVTVNSITGNGSLKLDLKNTDTYIGDAVGNEITTGFTSGQGYNFEESDMTSPVVVSINRQSPETENTNSATVTFRITFSEKVTGVDAADFTTAIVNGNVNGTITGVDAVGDDGSIFDVTVGSISGAGTLRLDLNTENTSITDATGNPINGGFSSGQLFIIEEKDATPPTVLGIARQSPLEATTNGSSVTYRVVFSEAVNGVDAADFSLTVTSGALIGTVETVTAQDGTTYDVTVSSISGSGNIRLDLNSNGTGIQDVAGNDISGEFTSGENYTIMQSIPTLTSVSITSNNSKTSLAKVGDVITLIFTASEPINAPSVTVATHSVTAVAGSNNSFTAAYTLTADDVEGVVPFGIDFSSTAGNAGTQVTSSTDGSSVIFDKTAPVITGINRLSPATENTNATTVTFRATFSEAVSAVDKGDFALTVLSGTVSGTLAENAVSPVGTDSTTYDVTVSSITGSGTLRLDVSSASTDIKDMAGNTIMSDYTAGQGYNVEEQTLSYGFASVTPLAPLNISDYTKDKPQAKAWKYAGKWWCVLPTNSGVKIFRLDVKSWVEILNIRATTNARADCRVVGDLVHILLYKGASQSSSLTTAQYDPATGKYKLWPKRTGNVTLVFPAGSETATILVDSKGRMWAASDGVTDMTVRWSDAPYTTWSAPIIIASGAKDDDICTLVELPSQGKIGLFWSNQVTERFGFRTHTDGADPTDWSTDEVPASQSAISFKYGMADDHMNIKVASDGTMYCGVKTGYNTVGYPQLSMLVRRPSGTWDDLYPVTLGEGTQPLVVLNEAKGKVKVVYTTEENGGNIMYKESPISNISFGAPVTLISSGGYLYNYSTSTHQTYDPEVVILATQQSTSPMQAVSVLASDEAPVTPASIQAIVERNVPVELEASLRAYPNPFSGQATVSFSLEQAGEYSLSLYDMRGTRHAVLKRGNADAGQLNTVRVDGSALSSGFYLVRLETASGTKTLKMILKK